MSCNAVLFDSKDCERCSDGMGSGADGSTSSDGVLTDLLLKKFVMAPWPAARGLTFFAGAGFASAFLSAL
jgi:hypothetical protein